MSATSTGEGTDFQMMSTQMKKILGLVMVNDVSISTDALRSNMGE